MTGWTLRAGAALLTVATLSACGDQRLAKLTLNMPGDSVATVMKTDTPHRTLTYLTAGRQWEVRLYAKGDVATTDSVEWRKLSPVVLNDNKVVAWGWSAWDKTAAKLQIPVPPK
ncbi:MAG: hypothetical protein ABJC19_11465 [Gemmatimonadota bacterium]